MSNLRVDSRWWYWVAAVPLVTAFWAVSSLWVGVVAVVVPEAVVSNPESVVSIPAVALGVPALVVFLLLPLALFRDARAIEAAGGDWPADPSKYVKLAAGVDALVVVGSALFFEGVAGRPNTGTIGAVVVVAAVLGGSWLCVRYLRERREHVAMPGTLWEWKDELRAGERREPAE